MPEGVMTSTASAPARSSEAQDLAGTAALVTGASSGIGEAAALSLSRRGAAVALLARRTDRIDALAEEIRDADGTALALNADVTDERQATDAVARTVAELGPPGHARQQRRRDAPRPGGRGAGRGMATDGGRQPARAPLLLARRASPPAGRGGQRAPRRGRPGQRQLHGGSRRSRRQRRLQRHQARRRGVQRGAAPGGDRLARPGFRSSSRASVETELASHNRPAIREQIKHRFADIERLRAADIADAITYIVTRPRHVAVNEMLVRPTEQEW